MGEAFTLEISVAKTQLQKDKIQANLLFLYFLCSPLPLLGSRGRGISQEWKRQTLQTRHVGEGRRKPSSKWLVTGWGRIIWL